jgi:hypothetical protein
MTAALQLREQEPSDGLKHALERFASGEATREDVRTLIRAAERSHLVQVNVQVHRMKRPARDGTVRLLGKSGPRSCEDRKVTRVADQVYAAWFDVDELRRWDEHYRGPHA